MHPLKHLKFRPYQISPYTVPTTKRLLQEMPLWGSIHSSSDRRVAEAPAVVFSLTQGDEGVETPLPNDSFKTSLSPPVGGLLRSFRRDWQTNKC